MHSIRCDLATAMLAALTALLPACTTIPEGKTIEIGGDFPGLVMWDGMAGPKLADLPTFEVAAAPAITATGEFPGHPIWGAYVAAASAQDAAPAWAHSRSRADIAFLRDMARSDGDVNGESVDAPVGPVVASR